MIATIIINCHAVCQYLYDNNCAMVDYRSGGAAQKSRRATLAMEHEK